jgi:hypothetical protein
VSETDEGSEDGLAFEGAVVHRPRWLAPSAVDALQCADFCELYASFKALIPSASSVPLAVSRNVGIPLSILLGWSESAEMFRIFAEGLIEDGLKIEELRDVPHLGDEGSALVAEGRGFHGIHLFCLRHWLEALGSRALQALLARRFPFARRQKAFGSFLPRTLLDFMTGREAGEITDADWEKFAAIFRFGVPVPADSEVLSEMGDNAFKVQALWGVPVIKWVSACSKHIEGLHGRLNRTARGLRTWLGRLSGSERGEKGTEIRLNAWVCHSNSSI